MMKGNKVTEKDQVSNDAEILEPVEPVQSAAASEVFSISRDVVNYVVVGLVFLIAGVLLGVTLRGDGGGINEALLRSIVREAVAEELIGLDSALASASTSGDVSALVQGAVQDAMRRQTYMISDDSPSVGPDDAPVVIVEFSDFLCSFCGRHYQETLRPLLDNYDGMVRYIYRDFPGVGGENAVRSALAAQCAQDQERFWDYHGMLFENQRAIGVDLASLDNVLVGFAEDLELDMETFTTCLQNEVHLNSIIRDASEAQSSGARGTPSFFINGTFVSGAQPYDVFVNVIDTELRRLGLEPPTGTG